MALADTVRLAGSALGALGGVLLFIEFFQVPSYVTYKENIGKYDIAMMPTEVREYTPIGQVGAFCVALGFALLFLATLLG